MKHIKLIIDFIISLSVLSLGLTFLIFTKQVQIYFCSDKFLKSPLMALRPYTAIDAMSGRSRISLKFIGTLLILFSLLLLVSGYKELASASAF
jgi:hypothetical protein